MLALLQFNLPVLTAALLIGVVTGAWIVRGRARPSEKSPPEDRTP